MAQVQHVCTICSSPALYKCPRCSARTCSAGCSKAHKEGQNCDGQPPSSKQSSKPWRPIFGFSQFKEDSTSIEDQHFMHQLVHSVRAKLGQEGGEQEGQQHMLKQDKDKLAVSTTSSLNSSNTPSGTAGHGRVQLSQSERALLQNAQYRRVWLQLPKANEDNCEEQKAVKAILRNSSHHEPFSDTILWTCSVKFVCHLPLEPVEASANAINVKPEEEEEKAQKMANSTPQLVDYELDEEEQVEEADEKKPEDEAKMDEIGEKINIPGKDNKQMDQNEVEMMMEEEADAEEPKQPLQWHSYTVHNIPESIRLATLLRQFLRPKPHGGIVIGQKQLDMPKLAPFIRASNSILPSTQQKQTAPMAPASSSLAFDGGEDQLTCFLQVELPLGANAEEEAEVRYYLVDSERTILENLRNRHVIGHPQFVVALRRATEFGDLELPMMGEVEGKLLQAHRDQLHGTLGTGDRPKWQHQGNRHGGGPQRQNRRGRGGGGGHGRGGQAVQQHRQQQWTQQQPNAMAQNPQLAHPQQPHFYHPYNVPVPAPAAFAQPQMGGAGGAGWFQQQQQWPAAAQQHWIPHQQQQPQQHGHGNKGWRGGGGGGNRGRRF